MEVRRGQVLRARLRDQRAVLAGAGATVLVAVVVLSRFGLDQTLSRDEAIYAYGGQRAADGIAPYASIFDPKGPVAMLLAGFGAGAARLLHVDDLVGIRWAFFVCAVLTVLAVFLLAHALWRSVPGALVAVTVFVSFRGFALDALAGPDAKVPGILASVLAMWLATRRHWFWTGVACAAATLTWQPFVTYPLVAVVFCLVTSGRDRWVALLRLLLGGLVPVAATLAYFLVMRAVGVLVEASVLFPLEGVSRPAETVAGRVVKIGRVAQDYFGWSGVVLVVAGVVALVAVVLLTLLTARRSRRGRDDEPARPRPAADREVAALGLVVGLSLLLQVGYALTDFQSYPDLLPLLVFPALGLGGLLAVLVRARPGLPGRAGPVVAALVLVVGSVTSAVAFARDPADDHGLTLQRREACALARAIGPDGVLYALGDPVPLVLSGRSSPDRFVYLAGGVAQWKVHHTAGGEEGWAKEVAAAAPDLVTVGGWEGPLRETLGAKLHQRGYSARYVGRVRVLSTALGRDLVAARGVQLTTAPTDEPLTASGRPLLRTRCGE